MAAASTTSQTSMPMRSHSIAISLTSAMLTERKMFSSSFVSSATSGVETGTTASQTVRYSALARSRQRGVSPPTTFGRRADRVVGAAGVDPLGREREVEGRAGLQAGLLEQRRQAVARRARVGRRLEHDELALLQHARERGAGGDQRLQVGLAVLVERRRHGDDDRVDCVEVGVVRGRAQPLANAGQALGRARPRCSCASPRARRSSTGRRRGRSRRGRPRRTRRPGAARRSRAR